MPNRFFLDTDSCIFYLRGQHDGLREKLHTLQPHEVKIPSIVKAELLLGAEKSQQRSKTIQVVETFLFPFEVVPFCTEVAATYAKVRAELEQKGQLIGPNDLLIAATALFHHGTLVTHNAREFSQVSNLRLEDWVS